MPSPRRQKTVAVSLLLSAALVLPLSPATAEVADADRVYRHNLPTAGQLAKIYDGLDNGRRERYAYRETLVRSESCTGYFVDEIATSGRGASYLGQRGTSLYRRGLEDPTVLVQKFAEKSEARTVYTEMAAGDAACDGDYEGGSLKVLDMPDLGEGMTYGYRELVVVSTKGDQVKDYLKIATVTRKGRYLVQVETRCRDCSPVKRRAVRATLTTLARIP